jgi:DNA-binding response OmpR family regulator
MPVSLRSFHRVEIGNAQNSHLGQTSLGCDPLSPSPSIDEFGRVRIIELADKTARERSEWLSQVINCDQRFSYNESNQAYLCQARNSFDVILISGDDDTRIRAILREFRILLPSKMVVIVLTRYNISKSVSFLKAGAADVFDCSMPACEAICRLNAIIRRIRWSNERQQRIDTDEWAERARIGRFCVADVTPMEKRILYALYEKKHGVVPYYLLASRAKSTASSYNGYKCLHVMIHHLRKKLVSGVEIVNVRGMGYRMLMQGYNKITLL